VTASRLDAAVLNRCHRMDRRVRIGLRLIRTGTPAESADLVAVVLTATAIALPYGTPTGAFVILPSLILLLVAIHLHYRGLATRRRALAAAGARRRDTAVITAIGPVVAIMNGALFGAVLAPVVGRAPSVEDALLPLVAVAVAVSFLFLNTAE
jgi:hypothetical protein